MTAQPSPTAGLAEGERRRDSALVLLRRHRCALVRRVQRALLSYILAYVPSTSDPVRWLVPLPPGMVPRLVGAAIRGVAELRLIRRAGLSKSSRPEAHGRDLPVWEINDRNATLACLATYPDLPDPVTADPDQPTFFRLNH